MFRRWWRRKDAGPVFAGLFAVIIMALLQLESFPAFERVGQQLFDVFQRAAPRAGGDVPVRVVDIDEDSIARLGQWPWPRTDLARLNHILAGAGAKVIAYDMVFSEPDRTSPALVAERLQRRGVGDGLAQRFAGLPDNDRLFADSMGAAPVVNGLFLHSEKRGRPVVPKAGFALLGSLPDRVSHYAGATQALPLLDAHAAGTGSLSRQDDADGIVRRAPLLALMGRQLLPSLSLEAVRLWQGEQTIVVKTSNGSGETASAPGAVVSVRVGRIEIPTNQAGEMWLHYARPDRDRVIPAWKLLTGAMSPAQIAAAVRGRIIFIGASAAGLRDLVATPLADHEPGVMIHAAAAEQMILGHFLERPDWAPGLEIFLTMLLGGGMALLLPRLGALAGAAVGGVGMAGVGGASWLAFTRAHYLLDPTYPALTLLIVYLLLTMLIFYREERRRAYIHNAFDRYLSPELVRQIAADPDRLELGGEEREMTVLMCDIRGFSRISERYTPKEVIDFLIGFLTPMSDVLLARGATLDKYIGDAILAFWNAPLANADHHRAGARTALAMIAQLGQLNRDMPGRPGQIWPGDVKIGIGLNSGLCCVGNMGSRQRLSYSIIGDTVNMASRLEGLTKYYGVPIIVGSDLARHLGDFALLELDRVRVVGRDAPETIFALLGAEGLAQTVDFDALAEAQAGFLTAWRKADLSEAERLLDALAPLQASHGLAGLGTLYRERLTALRADPPRSDWDGVYQAREK